MATCWRAAALSKQHSCPPCSPKPCVRCAALQPASLLAPIAFAQMQPDLCAGEFSKKCCSLRPTLKGSSNPQWPSCKVGDVTLEVSDDVLSTTAVFWTNGNVRPPRQPLRDTCPPAKHAPACVLSPNGLCQPQEQGCGGDPGLRRLSSKCLPLAYLADHMQVCLLASHPR